MRDFSPSFNKLKKSKCLLLLAVNQGLMKRPIQIFPLGLRRCSGCGNWIHFSEGGEDCSWGCLLYYWDQERAVEWKGLYVYSESVRMQTSQCIFLSLTLAKVEFLTRKKKRVKGSIQVLWWFLTLPGQVETKSSLILNDYVCVCGFVCVCVWLHKL